jgi:hypothetical protein
MPNSFWIHRYELALSLAKTQLEEDDERRSGKSSGTGGRQEVTTLRDERERTRRTTWSREK